MSTINEKTSNLQNQTHKIEVNKEDWHHVHPNLLILANNLLEYCQKNKLPFVVTSIIRGKLPTSVSDSHAQGRAFDLSVRGWTTDEIDDCLLYINNKWSSSIGAFSLTDNTPRAAIAHNGTAIHFHFQVRR